MICSLPDENRSLLLEQFGQGTAYLSSQELAEIALKGQASNDLAQGPDLYSFTNGEPIVAA